MKAKTERQKVWENMRTLKCFDIGGLLMCSNLAPNPSKKRTIMQYIKSLIRAGYIREINKNEYILIKNSGVKAPMLTKSK